MKHDSPPTIGRLIARRGPTWLIAMIVMLVTGCTAIDKRVETLTGQGKYREALTELESEGVGLVVAPESTREALRAREIYQGAVESATTSETAAVLAAGLGRKASLRASAGRELCPWSESLKLLDNECRLRVASIEASLVQLDLARGSGGDRTSRRIALDELLPLASFLKDSPEVTAARSTVQALLLSDCLFALDAPGSLLATARSQFRSDLALCGLDPQRVESACVALDSVDAISQSDGLPQEPITSLTKAAQSLAQDQQLRPLLQFCAARIDAWAKTKVDLEPDAARISLRLLADLHSFQMLAAVPRPNAMVALLTKLLLARADRLLADPLCAPLAWVYLDAAKTLEPHHPALVAALEEAEGSLRGADAFRASIAIDLGPSIEPADHALLFMALFEGIAQATRPGVEWKWVDPVHGSPQIRIELAQGEILVARSTDLEERQSRYLSHYEDVPNPQKEVLESRLRSQKISVDFAESSYRSAVSSHNINPSQWSLMSANSAKTRYVMAVDQYNATVREYNYTPDTVSEPVFVPYTYREGVVRSGVRTKGYVHAAAHAVPVEHSEIVTDNFRVGTRFNDVNEGSRRDDPLEIDVDGEATIRRITTVARRWMDELAVALLQLPVASRLSLDEEERSLLAWLASPLGPSEQTARQLELPDWVRTSGLRFKYPTSDVQRSPLELETPPAVANGQEALQRALEASCEVVVQTSSQSVISRGSGSLVSPDGLILTCAHVLTGPRIQVRFLEGSLKGEYEARVVRINDRADVAILQAEGLNATFWLGLQDGTVDRGLEVIAIGNPQVGEAGVAHAAVTRGTIVTPLAEDWGQPRVVAELPIASGSSGGPIVDAGTGRIVGVITAISGPQFSEGRASTGSFCLAAPASRLREWLGVRSSTSGG